jgi:glutaconate CoA-transferase subunit B
MGRVVSLEEAIAGNVIDGGAPEIATSCGEIFVVMKQSKRAFVDRVDFVTSLGHGRTGRERAQLGVTTKGPSHSA